MPSTLSAGNFTPKATRYSGWTAESIPLKLDIYQLITDRIIALLESGAVPWRKPWTSGIAPQNLVSHRPYAGVNAFLLNATGYAYPYWLTFKQALALGANVRRKEKAFPVVFWKMLEVEENVDNKKIPLLRYYNVFNVEQCEHLNPFLLPLVERKDFQPIERCEQVVRDMPKRPEIVHGGEKASYSPTTDKVSIPKEALFDCANSYYNVLFHELTHATGHASRLHRKEIVEPIHFGSDPYSREELVAEMGAAFLSGHCAIESATIENSVGYIQSWLGQLKNDKKLVIHAAAQAQKASDFILGKLGQETQEPFPESQPKEWKVVALRDCPTPDEMQVCDTPEKAVQYWTAHIRNSAQFNPECESFFVLHLNTRKRVRGHHLVATGTMNMILVHPREVFRTAIVAGASAIVLMHNHPSGEPQPSEADIKATRDLIRAGGFVKIEVLDHVIVGNPNHCSLRELGYFAGF